MLQVALRAPIWNGLCAHDRVTVNLHAKAGNLNLEKFVDNTEETFLGEEVASRAKRGRRARSALEAASTR